MSNFCIFCIFCILTRIDLQAPYLIGSAGTANRSAKDQIGAPADSNGEPAEPNEALAEPSEPWRSQMERWQNRVSPGGTKWSAGAPAEPK